MHRTQNVPAMRSYQAELPVLDAQCRGNHAVRLGRGLVTLDRVHGEALFEELREAGVVELLLNRFLAGVCQRHHSQARFL